VSPKVASTAGSPEPPGQGTTVLGMVAALSGSSTTRVYRVVVRPRLTSDSMTFATVSAQLSPVPVHVELGPPNVGWPEAGPGFEPCNRVPVPPLPQLAIVTREGTWPTACPHR